VSGRGIRAAAWMFFAAGLALGAAGDKAAARTPPARGGYVVLAGDFHVHSFPGDGALPPWDIAHEAQRRGLDVVGLTNHNAMYSWRLARTLGWTSRSTGVLVLPGDEVTGVGFHVAAIGLDRPVPWRGSIADVSAEIHAQGGVAIGAHPADEYRRAFDATAYRALDGIEAAHPAMFDTPRSRLEFQEVYHDAVAAHPSIAAIGSSDYHTWAPLGMCRTYLFIKGNVDRRSVIDAIHSGRTVACDGQGVTHGPADLSALVEDDCRTAADAPALGEIGSLTRAGNWVTWLALVTLVLGGIRD